MKKTIYSAEFKAQMLSKFHSSGMTIRDFAQSEGIKYTTLSYWLKREAEVTVVINAKPENACNLIDVTGQVKAQLPDDIVRLTVNGFRISMQRKDLSALVEAIHNA